MEQRPSWETNWSSTSQTPNIMEAEGSLPHLQEPATCPYATPDQSSLCPSFYLLKIHFNIIPHLRPGLQAVSFP
jgi:hypothetical protein